MKQQCKGGFVTQMYSGKWHKCIVENDTKSVFENHTNCIVENDTNV